MKIDGKALASKIIADIKTDIANLSKKGITPKVAIVTLGPEAAWESYVRQKIKLAEKLGIKTQLINIKNPTEDSLMQIVDKLNNDALIHGIIIQRPLTSHIKKDKVIYAVSPKKDIDGFIKNAYLQPPVWLSIKDILETIYNLQFTIYKEKNSAKFIEWLKEKNIAVLGKGETAGMPIIEGLIKLGVQPLIIDSKTKNKKEILKDADIIISAVGKSQVFNATDLKPNVLAIIGIGLHREKGKLRPDFREDEISKVARYYTPTPGGIGPLNLAYLFKNLITATKLLTKDSN